MNEQDLLATEIWEIMKSLDDKKADEMKADLMTLQELLIEASGC